MSNKVTTFGDPITNITEKDFGRVATDKDGVLRIRVQGRMNMLCMFQVLIILMIASHKTLH